MQNQYNIRLIFVGIFLVGLSTLQAQQKTQKDTSDVVQLLEVVVSGINKPHVNALKIEMLDRKKLDLIQSQTLGETLSHIPGVQNSYFGPNSGAPVIRSMSGSRVKILSNGVATNNLSGMSPNLNINVNNDNLLEVTVYKSQAGVLFGGKAIGGAVNMRDNTIPKKMFEKELEGRAGAEIGTNSGSLQTLNLNGNLTKSWSWHAGGMNRRNGNLKIPGNTKAPIAYDTSIDDLTQTLAQVYLDAENVQNLSLYPFKSQSVIDRIDDPKWDLTEADLYTFKEFSFINGQDVRNPVNPLFVPNQDPNTPLYTKKIYGIYDYSPVEKGIMPNSHARSKSLDLGTSYIKDRFRIGVGFRYFDGAYGIPGFSLVNVPKHTHNHGHSNNTKNSNSYEYAPIDTDGNSQSLLFETEYKPEDAVFTSFRLNYMLQFSEDRELVGPYLGNKFNSIRHALRYEASQKFGKFLNGQTGLDYAHQQMKGKGYQRYLPNNKSNDLALFTLQNLNYNSLSMSLGYRHDWVNREALPEPSYKPGRGLAGGKLTARNFDLNQYMAGLRWDLLKRFHLKASYNHGERAPDVNELYAGNNHFALMIEENGDDKLNKETAKSYEVGGGITCASFSLEITNYHTRFEDYLYLAHTGIARSRNFLVKEWRQSQTEITGWEATLNYAHTWADNNSLEVSSFFDLVKNKNTSDDSQRQWAEGDYMPNMPTSRYGFSSTLNYNKFLFYASLESYCEQRYLGKNVNPEPPMPGYSLVSTRLSYPLKLKNHQLELYISGTNLLNTEARPQNSYLKYLAPLPGRDLRVGAKITL